MADFLILLLVLGSCLFAFVAIGDLFDRFSNSDAEKTHRRWFPRSSSDVPAIDPRDFHGGYIDDTYGKGTWSDPKYPGGVRHGGHDPTLGASADRRPRRPGDDD